MKKTIMLILFILAAMQVSAFQIAEPANKKYNTTNIALEVTHASGLDNITYTLDNGPEVLACQNCSNYSAVLVVSEQSHFLEAFGTKNNSDYYDNVTFDVNLPAATPDFKIGLVSPEAKTYYTKSIFISVISNATLDRIRYKSDGGSYIVACTNCSNYNRTLNFSEGTHTVTFEGKIDGKTKEVSVQFRIDLENKFTFDLIKPASGTFESGVIPVEIKSNATLDRIRVRLGGYDKSCYNCSLFNDTLNLSDGWYTLKATGKLDSTEKEAAVQFKVGNLTDIDDDDNKTKGNKSSENRTRPSFVNGFEKLPKLLKEGEISDSDLADILRKNQLNPGIINRLIKTGKLGNESLDAILDHQRFKAVGIWDKMLVIFGYKGHTYAAQIAEIYELPEKTEQKLLARDDIPKGLAKKVQEKLEVHKKKATYGQGDGQENNTRGKSMEVGKQLPPGLEKKKDDLPQGKEKKPDNKGNKGKGKN